MVLIYFGSGIFLSKVTNFWLKLAKKNCKNAKSVFGTYISVPIGIDFSVLKWVYILVTSKKMGLIHKEIKKLHNNMIIC